MMDYGSMMIWHALLMQRQDEEVRSKERARDSVHPKRVAAGSPRRTVWLSLGIAPLMAGMIALHRPWHKTAAAHDDPPQVEEPGIMEEGEVEHV